MGKSSVIFLFILLPLVACNSSDSYEIIVFGPENDTALVGESIGLVLLAPESDITSIVWEQTIGPTVYFLGANRKVIGFDVPESGSYAFHVSFVDRAGNARSADYSFTASDHSEVYINARLDHEANARAKIALYAYEHFPGTITSVNWTQTEGPTVQLQHTDEMMIFFTAPNVGGDVLLQFRVDASDDQGNQASDVINILVEEELIDPDSHFTSGRFADISLADVYPYVADSPYADVLSRYIYSNTSTEYINLGTLPFIGSQNASPTTDEIMDRVLVSHDWMGRRFRDFLEQVDVYNDIKNLLGATTCIVISYDIRPSFFWAGTGAIYIDGKYFWATPEERDTLDHTADFRSEYSNDLQFRDPWRLVKDNEYAFTNPPIESRQIRTIQDSQYYVLRVFYHELAHANDFFPPRAWADVAATDYPWTFLEENTIDSDNLAVLHALSSEEMFGLGEVMFHGETATPIQQSYTPEQVGDFFFPDNATNTYNYSTEREDYAMLAEEYLMTYRYGVLYDQGITGLAPDYIISIAERGRVGHERIKPRAEYVISRILPSIDVQAASAQLPESVLLDTGISWWDTMIPPGLGRQKTNSRVYRELHPILFGHDLHGGDHILIKHKK